MLELLLVPSASHLALQPVLHAQTKDCLAAYRLFHPAANYGPGCRIDPGTALGLNQLESGIPTAFVLGGETDGVSNPIRTLADCSASIPMANKVESLNVAVTAALVAYLY